MKERGDWTGRIRILGPNVGVSPLLLGGAGTEASIVEGELKKKGGKPATPFGARALLGIRGVPTDPTLDAVAEAKPTA